MSVTYCGLDKGALHMEEMQHVLYNPIYLAMGIALVYIAWSNLSDTK